MNQREDDERVQAAHNHEQVGLYEIRVRGRLNAHWSAWFDGLHMNQESDGTTCIRGTVADQAALHGVLQKVRDLGLELLSITRVESNRLD